MDPDWGTILKIAVVVAALFFTVAVRFYKAFVKAAVPAPPRQKVPGAPARAGRDLEEFIDELRRDLGHGESPPPRTDGLLDTQTAPETAAGQLLGAEGRGEPIWKPEPLVHERPKPHETHPVHEVQPQRPVARSFPSKGSRLRDRTGSQVHLPPAVAERSPVSSAGSFPPADLDEPLAAVETTHWESLSAEEIEHAVILREVLSPPLSRRPRGK